MMMPQHRAAGTTGMGSGLFRVVMRAIKEAVPSGIQPSGPFVFPAYEQGQRHNNDQVHRDGCQVIHQISMGPNQASVKFTLVVH